jgi:hypothetical protein
VTLPTRYEQADRAFTIAEHWAQYHYDVPAVRLSTASAGLLAREFLRVSAMLAERMERLGEVSASPAPREADEQMGGQAGEQTQ